jgi:alpha-L-rhamnosidase
MTAPYDLTVDAFGGDVIVTGPRPRLSWKSPVGGHGPYQLVATVDGVELEPVVVEAHVLVPWPYAALTSTQRVTWRVQGDGGGWSAWHAFEVGLLDADWTADWVSPVEVSDLEAGERPGYRLATTFDVGETTSARLYATALGVYEAFLDGVRVGDVELAPGATSYDLTLYGQAYDIGPMLAPGAHTLELVVSDGWWRGRVGAFRQPAEWGSVLGVRTELHTWGAGGSHQVVTTADWMSSPSEIVRADLMDGQTVDLRARGDAAPALIGVVTGAPISWSPAPPVRRVETREPVSFELIRPGVWVADFGQNASGWVALSGPPGRVPGSTSASTWALTATSTPAISTPYALVRRRPSSGKPTRSSRTAQVSSSSLGTRCTGSVTRGCRETSVSSGQSPW